MLNRVFLFLIGFGLLIIGSTYIIMYLNLLAIGYSFIDYLLFIITKIECLLSIIGIILIGVSLYRKDEENDIYLWHIIKLFKK